MIQQVFDKYIQQGFDNVLAAKKTAEELEKTGVFKATGDQTNFHIVGKTVFGETNWQQKLVCYALG